MINCQHSRATQQTATFFRCVFLTRRQLFSFASYFFINLSFSVSLKQYLFEKYLFIWRTIFMLVLCCFCWSYGILFARFNVCLILLVNSYAAKLREWHKETNCSFNRRVARNAEWQNPNRRRQKWFETSFVVRAMNFVSHTQKEMN